MDLICDHKSVSFTPAKDIPSLEGKVVLVTGGNNGLGKQCVLEYCRHNPAQVWLAARNLDKARAAADEIRQQVPNAPIHLLELDLTSFESVKNAAATFRSSTDRLDILMLNAGIMATPEGLTKDGYEIQFGTNHMGHALLAKLLIPTLEKTAASGGKVRIVALSSKGHKLYAPKKGGIQFETLKTQAGELGAYGRYGQSKLANVLWARQMAKEYPQFTVASVDPGVAQTGLMDGATGSPIVRTFANLAYKLLPTVEKAVRNQLWASVASGVKSGEFYDLVGVGGNASAFGTDDELARKLWDWTQKELKDYIV